MPLEGRQLRAMSRVLARLAQASDEAELAELQPELGDNAPTLEQLACARDLLVRVAESLSDAEPSTWTKMSSALRAFEGQAGPPAKEAKPEKSEKKAAPSSGTPKAAGFNAKATAMVDPGQISLQALPFGAGKPSLASARPAATLAIDAVALPKQAAPSPWTTKPAAQPTQGRTKAETDLEAYVLLQAELKLFPQQAAATLRKHGIADERGLKQLDDAWQRRFHADAELNQRYAQLKALYG